MDISTPALLFSTISLLLLAYTNRFLALATLIRNLHAQYKQKPENTTFAQIKSLKLRVRLIRDMQAIGILSLLLCVASMLFYFAENIEWSRNLFGVSLFLLIISLVISGIEIFISIKALNIQLSDIKAPDENSQ